MLPSHKISFISQSKQQGANPQSTSLPFLSGALIILQLIASLNVLPQELQTLVFWSKESIFSPFVSNVILVKVLLCSLVICLSSRYEIQETDNAILDFNMKIEESPITSNAYAVNEIVVLHLDAVRDVGQLLRFLYFHNCVTDTVKTLARQFADGALEVL